MTSVFLKTKRKGLLMGAPPLLFLKCGLPLWSGRLPEVGESELEYKKKMYDCKT